MKYKTTNDGRKESKLEHKRWLRGFHERQGLITQEQQEKFWTEVFLQFSQLAQIIRQMKLADNLKREQHVASLNCEVCKDWEKHIKEWPHNHK